MNSHVSQKLGVAYKANLKHTVQIIVFIVVFSGIFNITYSAPVLPNDFVFEKGNNSDILLPHQKTKPTSSYLYLHANNNMWLEILPNGDVRSNTCPTRFGALESGSHSSHITSNVQHVKMDTAEKVAKAGVYLKGVISKRYLCVNKSGAIYSVLEYNETDCSFIQRPKFEINNSVVHYFKHLNHVKIYSRKNKNTLKKVRFQLGLKEDGTVFIVKKHTQRREEHKPMLSINKVTIEIDNLQTYQNTCANKPKRPKRRFKFCRKVWKRFFSASVKDLRRFRKYDCWEKLRQMKSKKRRSQHNT